MMLAVNSRVLNERLNDLKDKIPDDGGSNLLRNVGHYIRDCMALRSRRMHISCRRENQKV